MLERCERMLTGTSLTTAQTNRAQEWNDEPGEIFSYATRQALPRAAKHGALRVICAFAIAFGG